MIFKTRLSILFTILISLISFYSQAQTPTKYYFLMHASIDGVTLLPCEPEIAHYYSFIDPYTVNSEVITYYYLDDKKFLVESYVGNQLNSRKTFHFNGKKALEEKLVTFIVGSAGAVDGNNVSLYVEQFKTITAWDTAGVKTLKNGVGYTNFYDVKGNLISQKIYVERQNTNILSAYKVFYTNQQLMVESTNKKGIKYILSSTGDTLVNNYEGTFISKFSNDSVYTHFNLTQRFEMYNYTFNFVNNGKHYPNGNKIFEILPNGKHVYYYYNGQIMAEGFWKNGYKQGDWKWYDKNGKETNKNTFEKFDLFRDAVK